MKFLNIGYENFVQIDKITAITPATAAPIKKRIAVARDDEFLIDCTSGRKTQSVIFTTDDKVVLSALVVGTLIKRLEEKKNSKDDTLSEESTESNDFITSRFNKVS